MMPSMSVAQVNLTTRLQEELLKHEQVAIGTLHTFHAGVYARTTILPKGASGTGALVNLPTILVISGDVSVYTGVSVERVTGFRVLKAEAHRKQSYHAHEDTVIAMIYATDKNTVESVEREFTDEYELLLSHHNMNEVQ